MFKYLKFQNIYFSLEQNRNHFNKLYQCTYVCMYVDIMYVA
jgi:hypothetical protein